MPNSTCAECKYFLLLTEAFSRSKTNKTRSVDAIRLADITNFLSQENFTVFTDIGRCHPGGTDI